MVAAALTLSGGGLLAIVMHEGWTDTAIIPVPGDVPTIGPGLTGPDVKIGDRITVPRGLQKLGQAVGLHERLLHTCIGDVPLYQHEWDAYVSLAYNVGANRVCSSSIVPKLKAGDYEAACATISDFKCGPATEATKDAACTKPGGPPKRVIKGLENRRVVERAMCEGKQP